MTLQLLHERLLAWATDGARKEELLAARRFHFDRYGEPHEEDRTYEPRLNGMLDYYLYDHRPAGGTGTTIERFIEAEGPSLSPEELAAYQDLARNVHGLFEVRKIRDGLLRLRDVFTAGDYDVTERRHVAGLDKGDVLEARLLPFQGALYFSGAFLYHPREAHKAIHAEVKRLRKAAGKGGTVDVKEFLATLSRMAFKLERYRNVRLESIYDFAAESRLPTPRPARPPGEPGAQ
ncbi:hypothetical protein [Anaeromyxobacter dehalogenans]|uniref:Uncharacterized protein n=1 Tax=Anaeromyxobacter dehalogenans (strain 2CP-C) TaxID=290397 RepID=Q2IIB8_ANADE|nr:hypothetical protein [Anaeromyxobacter dehalogenans]ABC81394.1 hypothetical protein Adeh_1621 [Anaeromyxobacter dehalogenans 2CP-C]